MFSKKWYGNILSMHLTKFGKSEKWQNNKYLFLTSLRKTYIAAELLSDVLSFITKQLVLFSFLWLSFKAYPPRNLKFLNENYISCS